MKSTRAFQVRVEAIAKAAMDWRDHENGDRRKAVLQTLEAPNSFTAPALDDAIDWIMARVEVGSLEAWLGTRPARVSRRIAVLNAGNVPFVGLQDFVAVSSLGHEYLGVMSKRSPYLLPAFAASVKRYAPEVAFDFVTLEQARGRAEALIATGSTATVQLVSRRFAETGVPTSRQLLRGTRSGVAILNGKESDADLYELARDAFLHEGRGCRNVSVILAHERIDPGRFVTQGNLFRKAFPAHPTTRDGLARTERFLFAVGEPYYRGDGFVVVDTDVALREPCVVRWIRFTAGSEPVAWMERNEGRLQVVVGSDAQLSLAPQEVDRCGFGRSQDPPLDWRPDGIDTVAFLRSGAVAGL